MDQNEWLARGMLADYYYMFSDPRTLPLYELGLMTLERPLWEYIFNRERQWGIVYRYRWNESKLITIGRFDTREQAMEMMATLVLYGARFHD